MRRAGLLSLTIMLSLSGGVAGGHAAAAQEAGGDGATATAGAGPQAHGADRNRATAAAGTALDEWRPGIERAERYPKRRRGDVRFAIIEPGGRTHRFHAARTAPAASVFKAMLLATYLRQPSVRNRGLRRSDKRLLGPMIRRSDNVTATRVRDIVGRAAIERLARRAGMRRSAQEALGTT